MKVHARFITACGCTRDQELDHLSPAWVFPLMPSRRYGRGASFEDFKVPSIQTRTFRLDKTFHYEDGIMAEYREELVI